MARKTRKAVSHGRTRKQRKGGQRKRSANARGHRVLTIPALRTAMQHVSHVGGRLAQANMSRSAKVRKFQQAWRSAFGNPLERKEAEQYLGQVARSRTTRKMRGGMAPLANMMRQPVDLPLSEGMYPAYVKDGFTVPQIAGLAPNTSQMAQVPAGMGSNQAGGGMFDGLGNFIQNTRQFFDAAAYRPYTGVNPPDLVKDMGDAWKGKTLGPGGETSQRAWSYRAPNNPYPPIPAASVLERSMEQDVRMPPAPRM